MSSPFVIPFNFQPLSSEIKSSTYTIPAGRYAQIEPVNTVTSNKAVVESDSNLTINISKIEIDSEDYYFFPSSFRLAVSTSGERTITAPSQGVFDLFLTKNSDSSGTAYVSAVDGVTTGSSGQRSGTTGSVSNDLNYGHLSLVAKSVAINRTDSAGTASVFGKWQQTDKPSPIWLKSGQVITITGSARYRITEYQSYS